MKKVILSGILSTILFAEDLPKLNNTENLPKMETQTTENSTNKKETNLKRGLSYFDSCEQSVELSQNDFLKDTNCREYYSKATSKYLFSVNEYDLPSFLLNKNGNKLKFSTKVIVPQELIRDDKIYLIADNFNGSQTGSFTIGREDVRWWTKLRYLVNGKEVFGNNYLINLNGQNTFDLNLELIFTTSGNQSFFNLEKLYKEDKNKIIDFINKIINQNLSLQEKKRGEKKTIKLSSKNIGQVE